MIGRAIFQSLEQLVVDDVTRPSIRVRAYWGLGYETNIVPGVHKSCFMGLMNSWSYMTVTMVTRMLYIDYWIQHCIVEFVGFNTVLWYSGRKDQNDQQSI